MKWSKELLRSPAVLSIVAIQIGVYLTSLVNPGLVERLSLPGDIQGLGERPWSPLTVMFVHELLLHVVLMVLMLAAFGAVLEQASRAVDVLVVYLLAGLAGSLESWPRPQHSRRGPRTAPSSDRRRPSSV